MNTSPVTTQKKVSFLSSKIEGVIKLAVINKVNKVKKQKLKAARSDSVSIGFLNKSGYLVKESKSNSAVDVLIKKIRNKTLKKLKENNQKL